MGLEVVVVARSSSRSNHVLYLPPLVQHPAVYLQDSFRVPGIRSHKTTSGLFEKLYPAKSVGETAIDEGQINATKILVPILDNILE